jgi:hypothetical protein
VPSLELYHDYTPQAVHNIFAPDAPFTPQSGTWGLHGIIAIPDRPNDFLFFVTFGQQQGTHVFDEGITEQGRSARSVADRSCAICPVARHRQAVLQGPSAVCRACHDAHGSWNPTRHGGVVL